MLFDPLLPHIHSGNEGGRALSPAERPPEMFTLLHRGGADTHTQCSMREREEHWGGGRVLVTPTLELSASEQNQDHQLQDGRRRPGDSSGCPLKVKAREISASQSDEK